MPAKNEMTDEEITNIIATRVMGWREHPDDSGFWIGDMSGGFRSSFSPLTSDADCMAAWDTFSEGRLIQLFSTPSKGTWTAMWLILPNQRGYRGPHWYDTVSHDRRRAMCSCMCKAVGALTAWDAAMNEAEGRGE